jgi:signal transduction histidine kinase
MFLATLSHEMRTPLNAIVGWTTILRSDGCEEKDLQEGLAVIDRNTQAQAQLIEDVLDISRIVSGKLRLDIRSCELAEIIHTSIDAARPAAEARGITLDLHLAPRQAALRATRHAFNRSSGIWFPTPSSSRPREERSASRWGASDPGCALV